MTKPEVIERNAKLKAVNKRLDKLEKDFKELRADVKDQREIVRLAVIAMKADSNKQLKAQVKNLEIEVNSLKQVRWE